MTGQNKASRRQNYPQISKQIAISNRHVSLRYLQESADRYGNDSVTSKISEGKERKVLITARTK